MECTTANDAPCARKIPLAAEQAFGAAIQSLARCSGAVLRSLRQEERRRSCLPCSCQLRPLASARPQACGAVRSKADLPASGTPRARGRWRRRAAIG
eukprot:6183912-Pleurochrysis_carterae.AAC.1